MTLYSPPFFRRAALRYIPDISLSTADTSKFTVGFLSSSCLSRFMMCCCLVLTDSYSSFICFRISLRQSLKFILLCVIRLLDYSNAFANWFINSFSCKTVSLSSGIYDCSLSVSSSCLAVIICSEYMRYFSKQSSKAEKSTVES
jgi:hypothetical protein